MGAVRYRTQGRTSPTIEGRIMTESERQELRKKHAETSELYCSACAVVGFDGESLSRKHYPCDIIKVLDAWEGK